jgi:hypothetical protein
MDNKAAIALWIIAGVAIIFAAYIIIQIGSIFSFW